MSMCYLRASTATALLCALPFANSWALSSKVQLYGLLDISLETLQGASQLKRTGLSDAGRSGSQWGLKGEEDLGNGLRSIFNLESGFDLTTGTSGQAGRLFGRQAYIGLAHTRLGQLTLGRQTTLMIDWMSKYNAFGNAHYSGKRMDSSFSDRADQALKYTTTLGNISLGGYYSFGWNNPQDPDDSKKGRLYGLGAQYKSEGLSLAALYHHKHANKPAQGASSGNQEQRWVLGASYQINDWTWYGGYRHLRQKLTQATHSNHMYWVGLSYQFSQPLSLSASVYQQKGGVCDNLNAAVCPSSQHISKRQSPTLLVLGADYTLSKRTSLYTTAAYAHNKNASSLSVAGGRYGENVTPGSHQLGVNLGIRHKF